MASWQPQGGYTGGKPASEMAPPKPLPSASISKKAKKEDKEK